MHFSWDIMLTKQKRGDAMLSCCVSHFAVFRSSSDFLSLLCFSSQIYLFFRSFTLFHLLPKTSSVKHVMAAGTASIVVLHSTFSHFPECLAVSIVARNSLKHILSCKKNCPTREETKEFLILRVNAPEVG